MESANSEGLTTAPEILPLSSLRFVAAALVIVDHLQMLPGFEWIGNLTGHNLGAIGVSVFFVLSGYILAYTYLNRDWRGSAGKNCRVFFVGRLARIYPLHWLTFLIALPLGLNSPSSPVSPPSIPWLLSLTDYLWPGMQFGPQPVTAAWTLSCEALFYLITPGLFFALAVKQCRLLRAGVFLIASIILFSALAALYPKFHWVAYLRAPEFLLGVYINILTAQLRPHRAYNVLLAAGTLLLAIGGLALRNKVPPAFSSYLTAPGAALTILGCAFCIGSVRRVLSLRSFVLLGHASYALYLLHDPGMRYTRVLLHTTGLDGYRIISIALGLLTTAGILVSSILCYWYFETPARKWLRRHLERKSSDSQVRQNPKTPSSNSPHLPSGT